MHYTTSRAPTQAHTPAQEVGAAVEKMSGIHLLPQAELDEFREIFNLVDKDGGGTISKTELGDLMQTLGFDATPEDIDAMVDDIDQDGNGDIDFDEFVLVMSRKVNNKYSSDEVKGAFKLFDSSNPGYVSPQVLIDAIMLYGPKNLAVDQVRELVGQLRVGSNGLVDYAAYVDMMMPD